MCSGDMAWWGFFSCSFGEDEGARTLAGPRPSEGVILGKHPVPHLRVGKASAIGASSSDARPFAVTSPPVRYKMPTRLSISKAHLARRRRLGARPRADDAPL